MTDHPYLPDLIFAPGGTVTPEFAQRFADAGASAPARSRELALAGARAIQPARRRVTAALGRAVLATRRLTARAVVVASNSHAVCRIGGHKLVARQWHEVPGHYENWSRIVRCECGRFGHIQSCHAHTSPLNLYLPRQETTE